MGPARGIDSTCPRDYFRAPEVCGTGQGSPQEGHDVAMLYNTNTVLLESSKVSLLDSEQQRCLLSAVFICRDSGSRLVIGTTHLESGICDPVDLRVIQLRYVLSKMDAYHLPCSIVAGDYNLRQWEAERAKVWELKKHLASTLSMHSYSISHRLRLRIGARREAWELSSGCCRYKPFSWGVQSWVVVRLQRV